MFDLGARLLNPIDLSIGQPHFPVPEVVKDAAIKAIRDDRNRYTVTQGIPELNEAVLDQVERRTGVRCESSLITSGVAGGLTLALWALLDPDEQALVPDPYFVCYENLAKLVSLPPAYYDTYPDFRITEERLEAGMTDRVRAVLVNTPSNPTGRVLDGEELDSVARFARRHDLVVITDEIYDSFAFDGPVPSILGRYDQVVFLGGFGKTYGMPGWRLGYAVGPDDVIERMRTLQQFSFVCAPSPLQWGALAALDVDMTPYVDAYRKKRDRLYEVLSPHYELARPGGAFYAFPRVPGGLDADAFMERALARNLLVVPGQAFSQRNTHVRISFALEDDRLEQGLALLVSLAEEAVAESRRP
jgi:aspartate aminotransferase/aminotransferase